MLTVIEIWSNSNCDFLKPRGFKDLDKHKLKARLEDDRGESLSALAV